MSNRIEQILEQARWAPSGDNTQPWRFELVDDRRFVVYGSDTRDHVVYDLQGHASQLALGALLESIALAATQHGLRASFSRREGLPDTQPTFDVELHEQVGVEADPLARYLRSRVVQRRSMSTKKISEQDRMVLEGSLPEGFRVVWLRGWGARFAVARLRFRDGGLRLTLPEAFETHREIIEWDATESEDKIPDKALGTDPMTLRIMRWAMHDWRRMAFLNRYLAGSIVPRIQLDFVPSLACGAHFLISANEPAHTVDDFVAAGRAVQRVWLTATQLGLLMQPEMTPLIFGHYVRDGIPFTSTPGMQGRAQRIWARFKAIVGEDVAETAVFMSRIGRGKGPSARSTRLPVARLTQGDAASS